LLENARSPISTPSQCRAQKRANGQGSVYPIQTKGGAKRWVGSIYDLTGKRRTRTCILKKDAENWVAEQRIVRERGGTTYAVKPHESLETFLTNWVDQKIFASPETERSYRSAIRSRIVPYIGTVRVSKITTRTIEELLVTLQKQGYKKGSVMSVYSVLHGAFADAFRYGDLPVNPMDRVHRPKMSAATVLPIPQEDFKKIYIAAQRNLRWLSIVEISGIMGPRKGEYLALTWDDVNLDRGVITLSLGLKRETGVGLVVGDRKNHDTHQFPISSRQVEILRAYKEEQASTKDSWRKDMGLLFPNSVGSHMDPRNFNRDWKRFLQDNGLPYYNPHRLRKTAHTNISLVSDPGTLRALSGHKSVTTTLSYYVMPGEEASRAAVEKLNPLGEGGTLISFAEAKEKQKQNESFIDTGTGQ
jgi:integrase